MGGVDLLNRALSGFRSVIRGKKWYWPLVVNAINIAFMYSWRLYRIVSCETILQKDFRRHIDSRPTKTHKVGDEVRYDASRFSMKSDNTMTLLPQHVLYLLSQNVL